jgi:hypothetical protein
MHPFLRFVGKDLLKWWSGSRLWNLRVLGVLFTFLVNGVLHSYCLRVVADAVAGSTSLASGVANFAVIFIVLELDTKAAEALHLKIVKRQTVGAGDKGEGPKVPRKLTSYEPGFRICIFFVAMAAYLAYTHKQWLQCQPAKSMACAGIPVVKWNSTEYVRYLYSVYDVTPSVNGTVEFYQKPDAVYSYADELPFLCAYGFNQLTFTAPNGTVQWSPL